ncbi:hypothetical protein IMSHALPRED_003105 [Imshaugia aleurites]|uniref:Elongator complex protein 4 n=1 Tax=Imshaugia aleurites TaxID=172621 RepID=A0A8H3J7M1_9LECA|nr:hypothetical protein IMSHALPRED_003105 [Imshaugia aleurites]
MSFRKRNVGLAGPSSASASPKEAPVTPANSPGVRPSPIDGRPTTSTGTPTLDDLLAGHAGLALGNSLLIEENGTTDFAGALLRYYAAEGVVQGHRVHVVGVGEQWGRELPGLVGVGGAAGKEGEAGAAGDKEKMKIAWRYERLGEFGAGAAGSRGGIALLLPCFLMYIRNILSFEAIATPTPNRNPIPSSPGQSDLMVPAPFCHSFDLTKRLSLPASGAITFTTIHPTVDNLFTSILQSTTQAIASSLPNTIHRLIIPTLLSPALFPPSASHPRHLLPFLHSIRALLRQHPTRLSAMLTLPLSLYPRSTGLVCWIEHLCDGVLELAPFPHSIDPEPPLTTSSGSSKAEEKPQGMLKIHRLPVLTEKGGGSGGGDDLAFSLTRRKFVIKPFSLPPVEGDQEAQKGEAEGGKVGKGDIEF